VARTVEIRDAGIQDVYALARNLRAKDRAELLLAGMEPRRAIRMCLRTSVYSKVAYVDGAIAAMWGLGGGLLSDTGVPWLLTTPAVELAKVSFLKVARAELAIMMAMRARLTNHVAADYVEALRFLTALGFTIEATPAKEFYRLSLERANHGHRDRPNLHCRADPADHRDRGNGDLGLWDVPAGPGPKRGGGVSGASGGQ
jgi:hypothetical protein